MRSSSRRAFRRRSRTCASSGSRRSSTTGSRRSHRSSRASRCRASSSRATPQRVRGASESTAFLRTPPRSTASATTHGSSPGMWPSASGSSGSGPGSSVTSSCLSSFESSRAPPSSGSRRTFSRALVSLSDQGILDEGIVPLEHFLDTGGEDAVAAAIEMNSRAVIHPTVYVRRAGRIVEHELPPHPMHAYGGHLYAQECEALLKPLLL